MSSLSPRSAEKPGVQTGEVYGRRGKDVLEVGFGLSQIAAAAQAADSNALRQGAFDPGARRITFLPALRLLLQAAGLQGLMFLLSVDHEASCGHPPCRSRRGAQLPVRAGGARLQGKADLHDRSTGLIVGLLPRLTDLAGGALGPLLRPEEGKGAEIEAVPRAGAPAAVRQRRAEQVDALIRLTGY